MMMMTIIILVAENFQIGHLVIKSEEKYYQIRKEEDFSANRREIPLKTLKCKNYKPSLKTYALKSCEIKRRYWLYL